MKFITAAVAATIAFGATTASASGACDPGEVVIKFSHVTNTDKHPKGIAASLLEARVNEEMNGKACMEVFPNSTLYDDNKVLEALSHEPKVLFLDEPTAGVDVELRKDMWDIVADLKASGVTIILTTHYIEEAEAIADRVGVINQGELLLIEEKTALMKRLGQKQLNVELQEPIAKIPAGLASYDLVLGEDGKTLIYSYDTKADRTGLTSLLGDIAAAGLTLRDLQTEQSSLEDIFVGLVHKEDAA